MLIKNNKIILSYKLQTFTFYQNQTVLLHIVQNDLHQTLDTQWQQMAKHTINKKEKKTSITATMLEFEVGKESANVFH